MNELRTFLTVLSGSNAMSGTVASTISAKRFSIKFAYLNEKCQDSVLEKRAEPWSIRMNFFTPSTYAETIDINLTSKDATKQQRASFSLKATMTTSEEFKNQC